ncbi:MAG: deoxyribose-phosphate aldolase [Bifidobacteriaceae bacterium]|jgi:deoxyribose-phosphate aldolase|nr:deoxyribose-phosphate aldolase [Bifidobacteriaceae bacterium]
MVDDSGRIGPVAPIAQIKAQTEGRLYRGYGYARYAGVIDHSLLRPELTEADVRAGCGVAAQYEVASVCARPADVPLCVELLAGTGVAVGTVVGFPHGANTTSTKVFEAAEAVARGAVELDMVLNIGWLLSGYLERVADEIGAVVEAAEGATVKVILENAYLNDEQKRSACRLAARAGADFVKTSTGFAPSGATLHDLRLMRQAVPGSVKVKAAGGIRTLDALADALEAGISRCGATATAVILDHFKAVAR